MTESETIRWLDRHRQEIPAVGAWLAEYSQDAKRGKVAAWARDLASVPFDVACAFTDACLCDKAPHPLRGHYDDIPAFLLAFSRGEDPTETSQARQRREWGERPDYSGETPMAVQYRRNMAERDRQRTEAST